MRNQRVLVLFVLVLFGFLIVALRAAQIQLFPDQRLNNLKTRQFATTVTLRSRRGALLDRNGKELAVSVRADSLFADPALIEAPKKTAALVARMLGLNKDEILTKLADRERRFVWLHRQLENKDVKRIQALKVRGLGFIEESVRVYPNKDLAGAALGFVSRDGQGLGGIEAKYHQELEGMTKKISLPRDARGRPLLYSGQVLVENLDGSDVELTLDQELQFVLERELQGAVRQFSAKGAWGIILDPTSGEILALAQNPSFDPNRHSLTAAENRKNRLISDVYEPGSVVKPLVAALALDRGLMAVNSKFDCENGRLTIGKRVIREAEAKEKFGFLSVSEILGFSSNVGTVKIARLLTPEIMREGLFRFGLGEKTNIDLNGESKGIVHPLPWPEHQFATTAFGHGISTTAMQIAAAYGALANGGVLMQPYLVRSIRDPSSGKIQHTPKKIVQRVISKETSDKMRLLLLSATTQGTTGYKARVHGYPVGGKTGTAQKADASSGGYMPGAYIASFAGFVPAQDPRFVIYIAVDEPQGNYYGAHVAAPVFSRVAAFALRHYRVSPILISEKDVLPSVAVARAADTTVSPEHVEREFGPGFMPDVIGLHVREAIRRMNSEGITVRVIGDGRVQNTWPQPSQSLPKSKTATLFLGE